jgi:hypothetical protein
MIPKEIRVSLFNELLVDKSDWFIRLPSEIVSVCELGCDRPAKFLLKNSWLLSCSQSAQRCPTTHLSELLCYGCSQPATLMQTTGPVCGRVPKGVVKCPEAAVKLKVASMATRKLTTRSNSGKTAPRQI